MGNTKTTDLKEDQKRSFPSKRGMKDKHDAIYLNKGICGFSKRFILTEHPINKIHGIAADEQDRNPSVWVEWISHLFGLCRGQVSLVDGDRVLIDPHPDMDDPRWNYREWSARTLPRPPRANPQDQEVLPQEQNHKR